MSGAKILAAGAVSALGIGEAAFGVGEPGQRAKVAIEHDSILEQAGFARPIAGRASALPAGTRDRATELLAAALHRCLAALDDVWPRWREHRTGLAIGTSSGGMLTAEAFFAALAGGQTIARSVARGATYFAPLEEATKDVGVDFSPRVLVLGACASSTLAIGLALRWLELGKCEIALAGGFDALSGFVAAGFESLRATTATRPRPFRRGRDGMALGEGAGVIALAASTSPGLRGRDVRRPLGYVAGFGASTDAVHLTAPDETGQGLGRAAALAVTDAGVAPEQIDLVGAHATATPFNDPAEVKALKLALRGNEPKVVHPFKAQIGHTLGAAGVLESLALLDSMTRDIAPAAAGSGELDPECAVPLAAENGRLCATAALKLSSAFGGANAALVFTPSLVSRPPRRPRSVFLRAFLTVCETLDAAALARALEGRHPHLPRLDRMAKLLLTAIYRMSVLTGGAALHGAGLIVGHTLATLEQNELFDARRRQRGARSVEPRRFPATSPNAAAGECAIAFRLTGPTFAVGGSLHGGLEALAVARDLVAARDAETMLVGAADLMGAPSSALLAAAGASPPLEGACVVLLGSQPGSDGVRLDDEIPRTTGPDRDWIWTGPSGHGELEAYLGGLKGGRVGGLGSAVPDRGL